MNRLPNNVVSDIINKTKNVRTLVSLSGTSKRLKKLASRKLQRIQNAYLSLPRNRLGYILPLTPAQMNQIKNLENYSVFKKVKSNYENRVRALSALKKMRKLNVVTHPLRVTFKVPNGTHYTIKNIGDFITHRGIRIRVMFRGVKRNNVL